jgi:hypothetical protein
MPTDRPIYRLDIQDDGREANAPEIIRLRIVLKRLLRQFGFRCIRVEEIAPRNTPPEQEEYTDAS